MSDRPSARPVFDPTPIAANLERFNAILGAKSVRYSFHDYDLSLELFLDPATPVGWIPNEQQLKQICALGFDTVYCNFADDTEFIGCWRIRLENGRRVADGDYWVMSPRREKVGFPRYSL